MQHPQPNTGAKKNKPLGQFIAIICLFVITILLNIPPIPVNWNIAGQQISQIGGYYSQIPYFNRSLDLQLGLDLQGGVQLTLLANMDQIEPQDRDNALESAKTIIERRVNLYGVSEPVVQTARAGEEYRIIVELAGLQDPNEALRLVGTTARLEFREPINPEEETKLREDIRRELRATNPTDAAASPAPEASTNPEQQEQFLTQLENLIYEQRAFNEKTELTGKDLKRAGVIYGQTQAGPAVSIEFTPDGARKFGEMTQRNVGKPIGIFLDGELIGPPPVVQEPIFGGQATISGSFTQEQAKELATQLNAGALPVPIEVLEQRTVGATLGQQSVQDSLLAGSIALALVGLYMIIFYRRKGVVSVIALALYALLSLTIFRLIPITLTLAGVAGFILSIGMAIDANILIFERIKEEIKWGKTKEVAMRLGFERAWSSIRDSNVSSLITCLILYYFGTGLIRGFAITLAIGILVSMFTAITATRVLLQVSPKRK